MLKHPALSVGSRLRLASLIPEFVRARRLVNPCLIHTAADFDDESMAEYLTRKVGADFLENVVAVVYRNLWAWNVEQASKAYFLMIYPHVRNRASYTFTTGFGTLTRALADKLEVHFNTRVVSIELGDDCAGRNVIVDGPQGRQKLAADIVVCALPGNAVSGVVVDQTPWEKSFFAHVPHPPASDADFVHKNFPRFGALRRSAAALACARPRPPAPLPRPGRLQSRPRRALLGQANLSFAGAGPKRSSRNARHLHHRELPARPSAQGA
jgi:hypothetical protein